jgi:hypothetical protein
MPTNPLSKLPVPVAGARPMVAARVRRWRRAGTGWRVLRFGFGVALGLSAAGLAFTRGPVANWLVSSLLAQQAGVEYAAGWTSLGLDGTLRMEGVRLRIPGLAGPEGELLSADRVELSVDRALLRQGRFALQRMLLTKPRLRLSLGPGGRLNVLELPRTAGGGGQIPALPSIDATDGVIEAGEHGGGAYRELVSLGFAGALKPGADGVYRFTLSEQTPEMPEGGVVRITGEFDPVRGTAAARLADLSLDRWSERRVPEAVRTTWQQLGLSGRLSDGQMRFSRLSGVELALALNDVALNLPIEADRPGQGDGRDLRMTGVSGQLRLRQGGRDAPDGSLEAQLSGRVGDLPAEVVLVSDGLDPVTAGVRMQVWSMDFGLSRNPELAPYLPPLLKRRLAQFSGPTAMVDAHVRVQRGKTVRPPVGPPAPARWSIAGSVQFRNGQAAFDQFPYPFFDLSGRIVFDDQEIRIEDITGRGPTGARLLATGRTWPTDDPIEASLAFEVIDAPVDGFLAAAADRRVEVGRATLEALTPELVARLRAGEPLAPPGKDPLVTLLGAEKLAAIEAEEDSWRAGLFGALFSSEHHERLRAQGLILTPAEHTAKAAELAALRRERNASPPGEAQGPGAAAAESALAAREAELLDELDKPVFAFGGRIDQLRVVVERDPVTLHYNAFVKADFPAAGIVPKAFPLPLYAKRLELDILEPEMKIRADVARSLGTGTGRVEGRIDLERLEETGGIPELTIDAQDLMVDRALVLALPKRPPKPDGSPTPREMLERLNLRGLVDARVALGPAAADPRDVDVRVDLDLHDLAARPAPADGRSAPVLLGAIRGKISVQPERVVIDGLRGLLWSGEASTAREVRLSDLAGPLALDAALPAGASAVRLDGIAPTNPAPGEPVLSARIGVESLDLATTLEDLIAPISPKAAEEVMRLRGERRPSGRIDAAMDLQVGASADPTKSGPIDLRLTLSGSRDLEAEALGTRLAITQRAGTASVRIDAPVDGPTALGARFDGLDLLLARAGAAPGSADADVRLDGAVSLPNVRDVRDAGGVSFAQPLTATIRSADLDSPLARSIIGAASEDAQGWAEEHRLRGRFTGDITLLRDESGRIAATGVIEPEWLGFDRLGTAIDCRPVRGRLRLEPGRIGIESLRLEHEGWAVGAEGELTLPVPARGDEPALPWSLHLALDAAATRLDESLLALLPEAAAATLRQANTQAAGGLRLGRGDLTLVGALQQQGQPGLPAGVGRAVFDGELGFVGLSMDAGLTISDASGTMGVRAEVLPDSPRPLITLVFDADSLRVADLSLGRVRAVARTGLEDDAVLIEPIEGSLYGGRLAGRAVVRPGAESGSPKRYEAGVRIAGVNFADVLAELERAAEERRRLTFVGPPTPEELDRMERGLPRIDRPAPIAAGDASRGRLDADFSLAGVVGAEASRRGRGSVRVAGGDVIRLPLVLPMMELSNLALPSGDAMDFAQASFVLDGQDLRFDRIALLSRAISLLGWGSVRLPEYTLDLRFNSRGVAQLPLLSGIFEGLRNELITTTVTGTVDDPRIATESFSGTRRLIDTILGRREAVAMPDFAEVDAAARLERTRARGG